jgi:hypothetical protein
MTTASHTSGGQIAKTLVFGVLSLALYILLYVTDQDLLELSARGKWYFIIPVVIAFVFSYVHGTFTAQFWDVLGVKAKK